MRRHQDTICLIVLMGVLLALSASEGAAETCCHRELAMRPIAMPEGQEQQESLSTFFQGMVIGPLEMPTLDDKCPDFDFVSYAAMQDAYRLAREVFAATRRRDGLPPMPPTVAAPEQDLDYVFVGEITADEVTGKTPRECDPEYPEDCRGGFLEGTFTFRVKLVDHHRGQTLKEGSVSWTGHLWLDVGNRIEELSKSLFLPLDEIVREYERIPETAAVALPTEAVGAGETVTISLSDLFDHRGRQTQPWQRLLTKVEKGTILNGEQDQQAKEGYHVFRAGSDGIVRVQYRAPAECVPQRETLTVYNTCNKGENKADFRAKSYPQTLLATKEFNIVCDKWDVTITYTEDVDGEEREGDKKRTVSRHYAATFKARVRLAEADSRTSVYRSEDCSIDFHDNYNWHYVDNECNHRGGFTGEKVGRVPLPIEVQFNPGSQRYYFRFDPPSEVISYKFAGQLLGPDQHCTGAWEYEAPSSRSVLPADWEESIGQRQYTPGQTHITGNAILDGGMAFAWPDNPQMFEPQMRGDMFQAASMMNAQIGGYSPMVLLNLPIKQTLTWEIKRPE